MGDQSSNTRKQLGLGRGNNLDEYKAYELRVFVAGMGTQFGWNGSGRHNLGGRNGVCTIYIYIEREREGAVESWDHAERGLDSCFF